jgi:hypothetical protein
MESLNPDMIATYVQPENRVAASVALLDLESPDLAAIVKGWATLPDPIRAGILAMVAAAGKGGHG